MLRRRKKEEEEEEEEEEERKKKKRRNTEDDLPGNGRSGIGTLGRSFCASVKYAPCCCLIEGASPLLR